MADADYDSSSDEEPKDSRRSTKGPPVVDRNTHYKSLGWIPPRIPSAHQMTRQDLVILMTICSQVRFLSTGLNNADRHLKPGDVCSALTQDILDIEQVLLEGRSEDTHAKSDDNGAAGAVAIPKVIVAKKPAQSPIEPPEAPTPVVDGDDNKEKEKDEDDDSLCRVQ